MPKYRVIGKGKRWTVIQGNVLDYLDGSLWERQYYGEMIHFLFSDWPYNLDTIVKRFGGNGSKPAQYGRDGAFQRQSRGFMNATWDGSQIAYRPETWEALLPHLYPGAFTASFTHPRKQHRLAMAQEAAGYVMNPALYQLGWIFASGKPNGTRVDLICDKRAGVEREILYQEKRTGKVKGIYGEFTGDNFVTAPATPLARTWAGHQYGSPLAPELEPIIIAQAPWQGDRLNTVTTTGAGAVNIEAGKNGMPGRGHPGHLVITHHPGCVYRGVRMIRNLSGDKSGEEPSEPTLNTYGKMKRVPYQAKGDENGMLAIPDYDCHPDCPAVRLDSQNGSEKSYHFYQADWHPEFIEGWQLEITERLAEVNPVFYHGKVQESERNAGLTGLPLQERRRVNPGGLEREPRFAPTWQENNHPTLKPIKLCAWIANLFSVPIEYAPRRVLIPTCGAGSEMLGCLLSGQWDEIIGVELDPAFAEIACARLSWWEKHIQWGINDVDKILESDKVGVAQSAFI